MIRKVLKEKRVAHSTHGGTTIPKYAFPDHFTKREVKLVVNGTCAACKLHE